jgi:hypothetical protein
MSDAAFEYRIFARAFTGATDQGAALRVAELLAESIAVPEDWEPLSHNLVLLGTELLFTVLARRPHPSGPSVYEERGILSF